MHAADKPHIGGVIRALRQHAGLRQIDLAKRMNMTQGHIARLENGLGNVTNMKLNTVEAFADAFHLRASDLISLLDVWKEAAA